MDEQKRQSFEAWYASKVSVSVEDVVALRKGDGYTLTASYLQTLWESWQAAMNQLRPVDADIQQLMDFYDVTDLIALIHAQEAHIVKLQDKLTKSQDQFLGSYRK